MQVLYKKHAISRYTLFNALKQSWTVRALYEHDRDILHMDLGIQDIYYRTLTDSWTLNTSYFKNDHSNIFQKLYVMDQQATAELDICN